MATGDLRTSRAGVGSDAAELDGVVQALAAETRRGDQLAAAVISNRRIGIAVGLVMASRHTTDIESFEALRRTSMNSNRRLADVAEDVIHLGRLA